MTLLAGRYELTEPLGSGGMAEVFAGFDHVLRRRVAVKIIHLAQLRDQVSRERFVQEARVAASMQHPHTVAIFDVGEDGDRPFIVMELLEGQSLADRIRTGGRLPVDEAVPVIAGVLAGLQAAHDRGLVHRDVKPSNILLPSGGGVKLVDFGIATVVADAATHLTTGDDVLGTPRYMAPERVAGQRATLASDIYSLGAVMYECLSGRPPFIADTPVVLAVAHQQEPVRPVRDLVLDVPAGIAAVAERALAKEPAQRFGSADEMRSALLGAPAFDSADPPTTVLSGVTQQLPVQQPARRRWLPAAIVLLAVAVLGIAAAYVLTSGDDPGGTANPPADGGAETEAQPEQDDEPPPEDQADGTGDEATDLDGLIETVATADQGDDKTEDLLDKLNKLAADPDDDEARKLIEEIGKWTAEGELDPEVGHAAIGVLEQESRPSEPELAGVSELFAEVSRDRDAWGSKAENLSSDLRKLLDTDPPGQRRQEARKLTEEIDKWISKEEIDTERGTRAQDVLSHLQ